jgi:very-short-patch-repair endonuclease
VKLWNELKNGQLMGYDFDRQRPVGNYIVDFFCKDLQLAIEVDGITHLDEKVMAKDFYTTGRYRELWGEFFTIRCIAGSK